MLVPTGRSVRRTYYINNTRLRLTCELFCLPLPESAIDDAARFRVAGLSAAQTFQTDEFKYRHCVGNTNLDFSLLLLLLDILALQC